MLHDIERRVLIRIGFHRMNYGVCEPISAAIREFNEVIDLFDFIDP
jgi:hypothetical protein